MGIAVKVSGSTRSPRITVSKEPMEIDPKAIVQVSSTENNETNSVVDFLKNYFKGNGRTVGPLGHVHDIRFRRFYSLVVSTLPNNFTYCSAGSSMTLET